MSRVLFVRLSAMGDVVQGLGAAAALRRVRPGWSVTYATQRELAPLLRGVEGVDDVVTFDRGGGLRAVAALRRELRARRFDTALDLQGNWKSALVARLSGARERLGMARTWRQEPASRVLLGRTIAGAGVPHPARAAWLLVRALAADAPFVLPRLVATAAEVEAEQRALAAAGVDGERPFVVVVVTDPADPRALRPGAVRSVVEGARRDGLPAVCLLGPAERTLAAADGTAVLRHDRGEVRRLVALGATVAAAGGRVVGPDQGACHVLAAAGAPVRVLFGAQDPQRTAPPAAEVLVSPDPPACAPCRQRACSHPRGVVCMEFDPALGRRVVVDLARE